MKIIKFSSGFSQERSGLESRAMTPSQQLLIMKTVDADIYSQSFAMRPDDAEVSFDSNRHC